MADRPARPPAPPHKASSSSNGTSDRPPLQPTVSFQHGDDLEHNMSSGNDADFRRKRSLVRPEREKQDPHHRLFHYRNRAAEGGEGGHFGVKPSSTGAYPQQKSQLRRGISVLGREEPGEGGVFRRATRKRASGVDSGNSGGGTGVEAVLNPEARGYAAIPGPKGPWMLYCYILTICVPGFLLKACGIDTPERQRAWREKMGLLGIIALLMGAVGFITFGFTQTVCGRPPNRYQVGHLDAGNIVVNGYTYGLTQWDHPEVSGWYNGTDRNILWNAPEPRYAAAGMDLSFLFQRVNEHCRGVITPSNTTGIDTQGDAMGWYFPCNLFNPNGTTTPDLSGYTDNTLCHTSTTARNAFNGLGKAAGVQKGELYYKWSDVQNTSRNLVVFETDVLDLDLLKWLDASQVQWPEIFNELRDPTPADKYRGRDISMFLLRNNYREVAQCMQDVIRVGFIDTDTIGCVASDVVLYVSLVFIIGVVAIKFFLAVLFGWFLSWRLGSFTGESYEERMARAAAIENWTDDIYRPAPSRYRPSVPGGKGANGAFAKKTGQFLPTVSRFSQAPDRLVGAGRPSTAYGGAGDYKRSTTASSFGSKMYLGAGLRDTPPGSPMLKGSRSSTSLPFAGKDFDSRRSSFSEGGMGACPFPLGHNVVPQPPPDYEPFNFPLAHSIALVTAYSESVEGLRTTLDSLATTDYPNSHKLILIIADGVVQGSGNKLTTPDICLGMMKDLIVPREEVEAHSYVAIADGHKRHNMARVFAGFYDYDNDTVEVSKQQRVPVILVAKVGNPLEANEAKPGNRGKRDSQVLLMAFLQKVMFDERMTTFEYEFFNSIWRVTGVSPDRYELVLMVDADTKVFPDSLTRMAACMVNDPEIMGLCGETKIANKSETWVTMIQVFEYHISHHLAKAFESIFGGVTCLPGCFSMYRIKAPKGGQGYWVPVLANPDIVEHYSENVVDTLHKKNLLLLGEDRYLTTLMLKTFPKRKMMFCPQAVCKTVVPDTFRVLLSQRRRWINSTIHNLAELILVRDLCGTFCFSMQFVVFMELVGTLVLPAAIAFTVYVVSLGIAARINPDKYTTPTISLILLAIIIGLPGVLIVVSSRRLSYVGWMFVYLLSLPIWNFVLPTYAFWHFDDFSWGATRKVEGEKGNEAHGDKEGQFDSSHIVMKRWAEFERDRRYRTGNHSRDSTYDIVVRNGSPKRSESHRHSLVSSSEASYNVSAGPSSDSCRPAGAGGPSRERLASVPLLELPAPLAANQSPPSAAPSGTTSSRSRSAVDVDQYGEPIASFPQAYDARAGRADPYAHPAYPEQEALVSSPVSNESYYASPSPPAEYQQGMRHGAVAASQPRAQPNPYRDSLPAAQSAQAYSPEYYDGSAPLPPAPSSSQHSRGFSLSDQGPVGESPRRVVRNKLRRSSIQSGGSSARSPSLPPGAAQGTLPPGAAPPNWRGYQ